MKPEALFDMPAGLQVEVLLAALESIAVETYRLRQIHNDTGSEVAARFLTDHEHTAAGIKQRILTLFSQK